MILIIHFQDFVEFGSDLEILLAHCFIAVCYSSFNFGTEQLQASV